MTNEEIPMIIKAEGLPGLLILHTDEHILSINTALTENLNINTKHKNFLILYPSVNGQEKLDKIYRYTDLLQLIKAIRDTAYVPIVVNGDGNVINSSIDTN